MSLHVGNSVSVVSHGLWDSIRHAPNIAAPEDTVPLVSHGLWSSEYAHPSPSGIVPSSGRLGTMVRISGDGFGYSGAAWVGNVRVREISRTPELIRGTIAYGLGTDTYDVFVYNSGTGETGHIDNVFVGTARIGSTMRTRLRNAVKFNVEQLTTENSYRSQIRNVYDPPRNLNNMGDLPAVNLHWGSETHLGDRFKGNNALLNLPLRVEMDFITRDIEDPNETIDKFIADVQEHFGHNFYIPDEAGDRTVFDCVYDGAEPWGIDEQSPLVGATVILNITYRIRREDATVPC